MGLTGQEKADYGIHLYHQIRLVDLTTFDGEHFAYRPKNDSLSYGPHGLP